MEPSDVRYEVKDGIATLTLDNADESMNVVNDDFLADMDKALAKGLWKSDENSEARRFNSQFAPSPERRPDKQERRQLIRVKQS